MPGPYGQFSTNPASTNPDDMAKELVRLRQEFDRVKNVYSQITDMNGNLASDVFARAGRTDFLPSEASGMARDSSFSISNAVYTILPFETSANLIGNDISYDFQKGIRKNTTAGTFTVSDVPLDSIIMFCGAVQFISNSSGRREVRLQTLGGNSTPLCSVQTIAVGGPVLPFAIAKSMKSTEVTYYLEVYQNSGGSLDIGNAQFAAIRIA